MLDIKDVITPKSLADALMIKAEHPEYKVLAGGTDIVVHLRNQVLDDVTLLNIAPIHALKGIQETDQELLIGALTTFSELIVSELIQRYIPVLAEASLTVAGPQIRNVATLGGNIANGAVSADSVPSLLVYDAKLKVQNQHGERIVPLNHFFAGPSRVHLEGDELLTQIILDKTILKSRKAHYIKYSTRKAMDLAVLGVCLALDLDGDKIKTLKLAMGVAAPTPLLIEQAEIFAKGRVVTEETIQGVIDNALEHSTIRNSWRASKEYRQHLTGVLIRDCFDAITADKVVE